MEGQRRDGGTAGPAGPGGPGGLQPRPHHDATHATHASHATHATNASPASMMRISDEDRHKVAEVLRQAAGEGRIDLEELDERLEATYRAKTYGELVPITADLPVSGAPRPSAPVQRPAATPVAGAPSYSSSFAVMSECKRRGVWEVPAKHSAFSMMGNVTLDLREAQLSARETVIEAAAIMASVEIVVNPYTRVVVDGFGFMGDFSESRSRVDPELTEDSPVVRVKGFALMASVNVKRKDMPGEKPRILRGRR